jgi:23S rRNA (adenine2503-C2)-methyltransferase
MDIHPEVSYSDRLNVHFARMGEPTWNRNVLACTRWLKAELDGAFHVHPVVSTMMPKHNTRLREFIHDWMHIKNNTFGGNAGLQLSINSTDRLEREFMFNGNASSLSDIAVVMDTIEPVGRKITLNFAVAGYEIDPDILLRYFDPERYICKLTPMHKTATAVEGGIVTQGDYTTPEPYQKVEKDLKQAGYDVLVFIASREEDDGMITCGNAILSGSSPKTRYEVTEGL